MSGLQGEDVKKDQMLFEIYSPDLVATQDEYLLALKSVHQLGETANFRKWPKVHVLCSRRPNDASHLWDITPDHIEDLEAYRKSASGRFPCMRPFPAMCLKMNLREGMYVTPDLELYTVGGSLKDLGIGGFL